MMFQTTYDDLVAFMDKCFSQGEGKSVQTVGRTFGEHDLIAALGTDKISHFLPCRFMMHGRYLTQMVYTAVDITVPRAVRLHDRINHRLRLLTRRRVIQIHQRPTVYLLF